MLKLVCIDSTQLNQSLSEKKINTNQHLVNENLPKKSHLSVAFRS